MTAKRRTFHTVTPHEDLNVGVQSLELRRGMTVWSLTLSAVCIKTSTSVVRGNAQSHREDKRFFVGH
jgi:hypothetical protein